MTFGFSEEKNTLFLQLAILNHNMFLSLNETFKHIKLHTLLYYMGSNRPQDRIQ